MESSAPYSVKATWGSFSDLVSLGMNVKNLIAMIQISLLRPGNIIKIIYIITLLILFSPVILLLWIFLGRMQLGRIGTVYNQAGKARLVGITNYFIQVSLYPLHLALFELLRKLDTDGTFDQMGPLNRLIKNPNPDSKFSCFDLSSATDRLPLLYQKLILNYLRAGLGDL